MYICVLDNQSKVVNIMKRIKFIGYVICIIGFFLGVYTFCIGIADAPEWLKNIIYGLLSVSACYYMLFNVLKD